MIRFTVTREAKSFVRPSGSTPSESLDLSVIDRLPGLRYGVQSLHVFKQGQQPATIIRKALSKALVPYYPLAGRLTNDTDHDKVVVECNGEGAWFVEAAANCSLEDVKYLAHVPLLISENDLLPDPNHEAQLHNVPVMLQVTEFKCGGFVVGLIFSHAIADGLGAAQFIKSIGDFACGETRPTVDPVWCRHLFPSPPRLSLGLHPKQFPSFKAHRCTFDLSIDYITRIKSIYFEKTGHHCTTFDVSVATVWQIRTRAIRIEDPETHVHLCFFGNTRHLLTPEILPSKGGYYGNCIFPVTVTSSNGHITNAELVDIVKMIRDAKAMLANEFVRWTKGEVRDDPFEIDIGYNTLHVTDWTNIGFSEVDYGWGKPVNIIPLESYDFMAMVILGRPLIPKKGAWLMTRCVKEEHMQAFQEHMNRLA